MVPRVRTRAITAILPLRGTSRVPKVRPPLLPRPATSGARCIQTGYSVRTLPSIAPPPHVTYPPRDRCVSPTSSLSLTLDLIALPPLPTSPSPTQAPSERPYCLWRSRACTCTDLYVSPSFVSQLANCGL